MLVRALLILAFLVNPLAVARGSGCGPPDAGPGGHDCCCGDACPNLGQAISDENPALCGCAGDQEQPPPAPTADQRAPRDLALQALPSGMVPVSVAPGSSAAAFISVPRSPARSINSLVCVWLT